MICFLTSSTTVADANVLNPKNDFIEELRQRFPDSCRALFICSDPDQHEITDLYASAMKSSFEEAGFEFENFNVLDNRNHLLATQLINESSLIILAGGHVPTQNKFFDKIHLKEMIQGFSGVLIGISAGSMNSADMVYAQPELSGETLDPSYQRFLKGLGLTKIMLLPHYETLKHDSLDGLRVIEDITFSDSVGHTFHLIPDGSYLFIKDGIEELRGEAYVVKDAKLTQIAKHGERVLL